MWTNPYKSRQACDVEPIPTRRYWIRSYHIPFIVAGLCVPALAAAFAINTMPHILRVAIAGIAGGILPFDIPVCVLILWEWLRTGEAPELTLEPLIPTAERRALYRTWKARPQLHDDEVFYETFYADSGISFDVVAGVRCDLEEVLGRSLAGVAPADDMALADPELDGDVVFKRFERRFRINMSEVAFEGSTFDALVQLVASAVRSRGDRV